MDDMMNMSFDELRSQVAPAANTTAFAGNPATMMRTMMASGGNRTMMPTIGGPAHPMSLTMGGGSGMVHVPDHPQELHVLLFGPGAEKHATRDRAVQVADARTAQAACKGKRDFILFEDLDDAVRQNRKIILVLPLGAGRTEVGQAQAYLAESLGDWLREQKTDGSGRPYGESKDEDPTLRKHFTRSQILAIQKFGGEGSK